MQSAGPPPADIGAIGGVHPFVPLRGSSCKPRGKRLEEEREELASKRSVREGVGGVWAVAGSASHVANGGWRLRAEVEI